MSLPSLPAGVSLHRKSNKFLFCQMISPPYTNLHRPAPAHNLTRQIGA